MIETKDISVSVEHRADQTALAKELEARVAELTHSFSQWKLDTSRSLRELAKQNARMKWEIETLRNLKSKIEISSEEWWGFQEKRANYDAVPSDPLVSVLISTHDRKELLLNRSLPSVIKQTYKNLEIIVVCDGCSDGTANEVKRLHDDRVKVLEIPSSFPKLRESSRRWMVSGSIPNNYAQKHSEGFFITHLDDDDEFSPSRIQSLMNTITKSGADLVYHPFLYETREGKWITNSAPSFDYTHVTTSSIFYKGWLREVWWDPSTHLLSEPADWNRMRRMLYVGAVTVRHPETLTRHYRERNQAATRDENE